MRQVAWEAALGQRSWEAGRAWPGPPHFPTGFVLPEQMNAEAHVRKLEDNLSEANAKVAELERNQAEINAIRTRLQGELSPPRSFLRNSAWKGAGILKETERGPGCPPRASLTLENPHPL